MRDYPTNKRMMLFSGSSNPSLALKVAEYLNIELGQVERKRFKNGEIYIRFMKASEEQMFLLCKHVQIP